MDCEEEDEILPLSQATVAFEPRPDGRKSADIFVSNEKKLGEKKAENSIETYEKALQKTESKIDAKNTTSETMIIDSKVDFTSYESFNSKHEKSREILTLRHMGFYAANNGRDITNFGLQSLIQYIHMKCP